MSNINIEDIQILHEDEDTVVVSKPAGLMVHPDGRQAGPFLTDWVEKKYPASKNVGETINAPDGSVIRRPGIVHRLDKETSGAIVIAKTDKGFASLKKQFQDRAISKKYLVFVWGEMKEDFGTINRPIGRSGSDFRRWSAERGARGEMRDAETYWTKLHTYTHGTGPEKYSISLVSAEPKTGRTHQIRVHFASLQRPVVGDVLYGTHKPKGLGFERVALHSWLIQFRDLKGNLVRVVAPVPEDFRNALKMIDIDPDTLKP
jgi:23S rRNA pseudouridine1911/1915/1917 synthase